MKSRRCPFRVGALLSAIVRSVAGTLFAAMLGNATAQTAPRITQANVTEGTLVLSWTGGSGFYELQATTRLDPANWRPFLRTALNGARITPGQPYGFFRLLARPGPVSTTITDQRRLELLDTISRKIETFAGDDNQADSEQLADFLSGFPEFSGVGVSPDTSVWARFTDGRPLLLFNNRSAGTNDSLHVGHSLLPLNGSSPAPAPLRTVAGQEAYASPAPGSLRAQNIALPTGIPASQRALLFKATLPSITAPNTEYLTPLLLRQGYQVAGGEASLENFMNVQSYSEDVGILYIDSHGGFVEAETQVHDPETGAPVANISLLFVVATSTTVDFTNEQALQANWDRGVIAYSMPAAGILKGLARDPGGAKPLPIERKGIYCITGEFVRQYWSFGRNSFVYLDTCLSGSDLASPFRNACAQKGASVIAGWNNSVHDTSASRTTKLLFDAMLGGSQIVQTTPAQRPFDLMAVYRYMVRNGLDTDPIFGGVLKLSKTSANGEFGLLAPSIRQLSTVGEDGKVSIDGLFDQASLATVQVEGNGTLEFQVIPDSSTSLVIPWAGTQSPSAGNVTVIQHGHRSNTAPLTEWRVPAHLIRHFSNAQREPFATIDFNLHVRADLHKTRLEPYGDAFFLGNSGIAEPDSTGRVISVEGMYDDGHQTIEWMLPSPVDLPRVWYFDSTGSLGFKARVTFPSEGQTAFEASATAKNSMTVITTTQDGEESQSPGDPAGISTHAGTKGSIDQSYQILGGDDSSTAGARAFGGRFSWESAPAQNPRDPGLPGYAE